MALASELQCSTNSVNAAAFSFMTDQEILNGSRVKVTETLPFDNVDRPVKYGLYDPAFGPLVDNFPCKTCGLLKSHCPGHFGHIPLVAPVYNPLMFNFLSNIIKKTCFFCHHFMASRNEVESRLSQLKLIEEGSISKSKSFDECLDSGGEQFSKAMSVLTMFLHEDYNKCQNCGKFSPKITEPIFGWFHMEALSDSQARANDITESDASFASERSRILSNKLIEKTSLSGYLLPSEVREILQFLWESESKLCSIISDIQNQGFGKKAGHSMFFLENIFVAPIKFRPQPKVGDNEAHHPQTSILNKVLESNKSLGQAYLMNSDAPTILSLWMNLQQSVNILFDNTTTSKSQRDATTGICQLLEKKQGIFCEKMMGKRVNFAGRSLISPDTKIMGNSVAPETRKAKNELDLIRYEKADACIRLYEEVIGDLKNPQPGESAEKLEMRKYLLGGGCISKLYLSILDPCYETDQLELERN